MIIEVQFEYQNLPSDVKTKNSVLQLHSFEDNGVVFEVPEGYIGTWMMSIQHLTTWLLKIYFLEDIFSRMKQSIRHNDGFTYLKTYGTDCKNESSTCSLGTVV